MRELFAELRAAHGARRLGDQELRAALSAMFATAVEDGLLRSNPVPGVRIPRRPSDERRTRTQAKALTRAELALLLAACPSEWRLFFEFLAHTGLRIGEAIGLTLGARRARRPAAAAGPRAGLPGRAAASSRAATRAATSRSRRGWRSGCAATAATPTGASGARVRLSDRAALHPSNCAPGAQARRDAAGLLHPAEPDGRQACAWVSFHTFRHTCASLLFEAGKNVKQVQEWLGHADPGFTLRTYVHLMDDGLGDADFLDDAVEVVEPAPQLA